MILGQDSQRSRDMDFPSGEHKQSGLRYSPLKALISPRPIGWISSRSVEGVDNLAPYSFFNAISEQPAMVMFVASPDRRGRETGQMKDSLQNILDTKMFAVNITSEAQIDQMVRSAREVDASEDEFALAELQKKEAKTINVPLVADAPAHLECRYHQHITLPANQAGHSCVMVIGNVIHVHIDDRYISDGKVDVSAYQPVARLGYKDYSVVSELFEKQP